MDTTTLSVGQSVYALGTSCGGWAWVIEANSTGAVVQFDHPACGVFRFDRNGLVCDSDIDLNQYKDRMISLFLRERVVPTSDEDLRGYWAAIQHDQEELGNCKQLGADLRLYYNLKDAGAVVYYDKLPDSYLAKNPGLASLLSK